MSQLLGFVSLVADTLSVDNVAGVQFCVIDYFRNLPFLAEIEILRIDYHDQPSYATFGLALSNAPLGKLILTAPP